MRLALASPDLAHGVTYPVCPCPVPTPRDQRLKKSAPPTSDADILPALAACPQSVIDRYRHETVGCYDWDGWRFILPDLPANARLLCIDTRYGTTAIALAQLGAQVSLAHHDAVTLGLIRERAAQHGCAIVESTCFPKTAVQLCIVHRARHSLNYVGWKLRKEVAADLRAIYTAATVSIIAVHNIIQ